MHSQRDASMGSSRNECIPNLVDHGISNREAGCCGGAGRIEHMECVRLPNEIEILQKFAGGRKGLGANARASLCQIIDPKLGYQPLQRLAE